MSRKSFVIPLSRDAEINLEAAYQADVFRHKIKAPTQPPAGIYWDPDADEGGLIPGTASGTVRIYYASASRRTESQNAAVNTTNAGPAVHPGIRESVSSAFSQTHILPRPIMAAPRSRPKPTIGSNIAPAQQKITSQLMTMPLTWSSSGPTPQAYGLSVVRYELTEILHSLTASQEPAAWEDRVTYALPPDDLGYKRTPRLVVDTADLYTWSLSQGYQFLPAAPSTESPRAWPDVKKACYADHRTLTVEIDPSTKHAIRAGEDFDLPNDGSTINVRPDGTRVALSFFKTTLRLYAIMGFDPPRNFNVLDLKNVTFGVGYAASSTFVAQDYDGVIGLGRAASNNDDDTAVVPVASIIDDIATQYGETKSFYIRFHPDPDDNAGVFSFVAFGLWPPEASFIPEWKILNVVDTDGWRIRFVGMDIIYPDRTVTINGGFDVKLDSATSFSYFPHRAFREVREALNPGSTVDQPIYLPSQFPLKDLLVRLKFARRNSEVVEIQVHAERFLKVPGDYSHSVYGNCAVHAVDSNSGYLGINFFQSAFVGFHRGGGGRTASVGLASYKKHRGKELNIRFS